MEDIKKLIEGDKVNIEKGVSSLPTIMGESRVSFEKDVTGIIDEVKKDKGWAVVDVPNYYHLLHYSIYDLKKLKNPPKDF